MRSMGLEAYNDLQRLAFHFRVAGNEYHGCTMSNLRFSVVECIMKSSSKPLVLRTKDQLAKTIPDLRISCQPEVADTGHGVDEQFWSSPFGIVDETEQQTPPP